MFMYLKVLVSLRKMTFKRPKKLSALRKNYEWSFTLKSKPETQHLFQLDGVKKASEWNHSKSQFVCRPESGLRRREYIFQCEGG